MRYRLAAILLCAAGAAWAQGQPTLQKIRDSGVVTIGHRTDSLPFSYLDANKRPIGYGIEICQEILTRLRAEMKLPALKVHYLPLTAANRFEVVNSGKADLECGSTVNSRERRGDASYAMPYFFTGPRMLVRANAGIGDYMDLRGKRIVTSKGAIAAPIVEKKIQTGQIGGAKLILTEKANDAFEMLEKGEADAYITSANLLAAYRANAKDPAAYVIAGDFLTMEAVAILLPKGDVEFKRAIDRHLTALMMDGLVARLYAKWFQSPVPPRGVNLEIPMSALLRDQLRWPIDRTGDETN